MRTTFAARDYTGEEISDEALHDILDNARFAPSGGNRQGNRVIVVRDQATRDALSKLAAPAAQRYAAQVKRGEKSLEQRRGDRGQRRRNCRDASAVGPDATLPDGRPSSWFLSSI